MRARGARPQPGEPPSSGLQLSAGDAKRVLRRLVRDLRPYRRRLLGSVALIVTWTMTVLAGPYLVRDGIDNGILRGDGGRLNRDVILYVAVAAVGYVAFRSQVRAVARLGEGYLLDLRRRVFAHLQDLSMPFYERERSGVIVSRMTADIESMQELVQQGLLMMVANTFLLLVSVVVLASVSWPLLLTCAIVLPFVFAASGKFQRDSSRAYLAVRDRIGATLSHLQEGVTGVRVIQAFGREEVEASRFSQGNRALYDAHMNSVRISAWYLPIIELAGIGTTALIVGVGAWMVSRDLATIGTVTFFVLTLSNLFEPVQQLSQLFNQVQSAGAGLQKLYGVLDTPVDVPERRGAVDLPSEGAVVVRGASFAYGSGPTVLHDVNLTIAPGERIALVGPTGAGKSTLAKLVVRFYDPTEGSITFGGVDLRDATRASLRERIVVVPQEGFLFNGSLLDNVRIGRPEAGDAEAVEALRAVGALDRFAALPEGVNSPVRERGSRLSAGEKQLVSLARAALADPAVLVLDEATSSLDPGTESAVEEALDRLMQGRTVIVIAHRLTTAARADRVAVVDGGRLVELGTHAELIDANGRYATLFQAWMAGLMP